MRIVGFHDGKAEGISRCRLSGHCNAWPLAIEKKNDEPTDGGRRALGLDWSGIYIDGAARRLRPGRRGLKKKV